MVGANQDAGSTSIVRVLFVEDQESDRILAEFELEKAGFSFVSKRVENESEFILELDRFMPDIVLLDFSLPRFDALRALAVVGEKAPDVPCIVLTGTLTDEIAVETLKAGAVDYVLKEKMIRLPSAIRRAIELKNLKIAERESERKLRKSENQLRLITDALPALVVYVDSDQRINFLNAAYEKWFGIDRDTVRGKPIREVTSADVYREAQPFIQRVLSGAEAKFELTFPHSRLGDRVMRTVYVPDFAEDGSVRGFVSLMTDITDLKKNEDELQAAKEVAEAANRSKSQFLANVSHEIRTPLNAIMGFAELLLEAGLAPDDYIGYVAKIRSNGRVLERIIGEILDLSKIEAGRIKLDKERFSLQALLLDLKSSFDLLSRKKNLQLIFQLEGLIPKHVHSDPLRLRQILSNLVDNAIKFTEKGMVRVSVSIRESKDASKLIFVVEDTGKGISKKEAQKLFQPFVQADQSIKRKFGGTGLGLALSRKLARALGGDVKLVKSIPGKGSTFMAEIDIGSVDHESLIDESEFLFRLKPWEEKNETARLERLKVLVVDDSEDNRALMSVFLGKEGADVEFAINGREGVEKAIENRYDVILMDIQMPELDGYEATSYLRKKGLKTPILALTAHAMQEEKDLSLRKGFTAHLTKPVDRAELIRQVAFHGRSQGAGQRAG